MSRFAISREEAPEDMRAGAIIVCAGQSTRMSGIDKAFMPLLKTPLLAYTIASFQAIPQIEAIVLVLNGSNLERGKALVKDYGFTKVQGICIGGDRRQDSVWQGLQMLGQYPWVVVHDGARPCIEPEIVKRGLKEAAQWGSAVAAVPVKDTIKVARGNGTVQETPDRRKLWTAQTPQIFPWDVLYDAYQQNTGEVTDDASLVEQRGYPVHLYFGSYSNIKVTTRDDGLLAELLLRQKEDSGDESRHRV